MRVGNKGYTKKNHLGIIIELFRPKIIRGDFVLFIYFAGIMILSPG